MAISLDGMKIPDRTWGVVDPDQRGARNTA